MMLNDHDNLVLVAPRPVRLAAPSATTPYPPFASAIQRPIARTPVSGFRLVSAPADAFDRLKISEDGAENDIKSPETVDRNSVSPRASPRSNLPSEALEEFFSIFNSHNIIFPPSQTSPILRASNPCASHAQAFFNAYRRSPLSSLSPTLPSEGLGLTLADHGDERKDGEAVAYPFKLLGPRALGSPVSRTQTRLSSGRQPSFDGGASIRAASTSPSLSAASTALSPAAIPLPLPTPDEAMESEMVS